MKQIIETLKSYKHAIIWTVCYVCVMWAILYFMFNFDLFSLHQWHHLLRAELHGFAGFVFGILMLAALPLYIASTTLIIRTKKPLITIRFPQIKIPTFLKSLPQSADSPVTTETPTKSETPSLGPDAENTPAELPPDLPDELRVAFIRARHKVGTSQTSIFNSIDKKSTIPPAAPQPEISDTESDSLPIPLDFDLDIPDDIPAFTDTPTFTEINFDAPETTDETPLAFDIPAPDFDTTVDNSEIINHLTTTGTDFTTRQELVITPTYVITTHSDPRFWVTDTDNWFASGAVRPSPIKRLKSISESENLTPVLYLAATNIMDLEKLQPEWESSGIRIITSVSDL